MSAITFAAQADSRVLQASPNTNDGTLSRLDIDSPGEESYIRFSVSGVSGTVQSATLRLFVDNGSQDGPSLYLTDDSWTETGITWNNRPAPISGAIANVDLITPNSWAEYDLTAQITGDGTYNFVFLPDSKNGVRFDSREGGSPPELVVVFAAGPTPTQTNSPIPATATHAFTPTNTPTTGPSPTNTPNGTPTYTPTIGPSPTPTITPLPTATPTFIPTLTPVPPTATPTNIPAITGVTLAPVADSRVLSVNPNTNFGTQGRLDVDSPGEESYIRFAVNGVSGTVQSARLRLFVTNGSSDGPSIYGTDNTWTETDITWNNRPAPDTGVLDNVDAMSAGNWTEYDLTDQINGNGTYSFVLQPDSRNGVRFDSREGGSPPELVLTW